VPILLQGVHRISGHSDTTFHFQPIAGNGINPTTEKCPVCVYEFCSFDELKNNLFEAVLKGCISIIKFDYCQQFLVKVIDYSLLRAPPVS